MAPDEMPWLLVLVDGPSEMSDGRDGVDAGGVVREVLCRVFTDLAAQRLQCVTWKQFNRASPLRTMDEPRIKDRIEKARRAARIGDATTALGTILLVDNDGKERDWCAEVTAAIATDNLRERTAIGVAREMIEPWLLADPNVCGRFQPPTTIFCILVVFPS